MSEGLNPSPVPAVTIATKVVRRLQEAGFASYFAGGCVRDGLMGRMPKDYDIATAAHPNDVVKLFPKSRKVGAAFGVILVFSGGRTVEVATFRTDGVYEDGRRPSCVHFTNAKEDALRRDFSCNGLFFDPLTGTILDFVGGQQDIKDKLLRAIGDPARRFAEDHLRMMRAVRFAARLNFSIHCDTWAAMRTLAPNLQLISRERIGQELRFMLAHSARVQAVDMLVRSGLLAQIWPVPIAAQATVSETKAWLAKLPSDADIPTALVAMAHDVGLPGDISPAIAGHLQEALALSGQERTDIAWLLEKLPVLCNWRTLRLATLKRLMADPRFSGLLRIHQCAAADPAEVEALRSHIAELAKQPIAPPPYVTGNDLISLGAPAGPNFRRWLEELYDRQLENEFSDKSSALAAAQKLIHAAQDEK